MATKTHEQKYAVADFTNRLCKRLAEQDGTMTEGDIRHEFVRYINEPPGPSKPVVPHSHRPVA